jgi:CRISPR-associated protein Csd1
MGIIYYRELLASEFLHRLDRWHQDFAWPQRHNIEAPQQGKKKQKKEVVWLKCSPAPRNIADAAYGDILKSNETLKKNVMERIVPCIVDGRHFPRDIMETAARRACNRHINRLPEQYSNLKSEQAAWERHLGVACALYKGYYIRHPITEKRREYDMALEEDRRSRDYLYGRLLAIAEWIEEIALNVAGEKRPTTAARLMQRFADRPYSTWRIIEPGLQPYMQRLQSNRAGFLVNRQKELDSVMSMFEPGDFPNDKALDGEFLLGYHCQKQHWRETQDYDDNKKQESNRGEK